MLIWAGVGAIVLGSVIFLIYRNSEPGELDDFAMCLKARGAVFYGAFWCPHCQNQKAMFGRSARLLPYVECSTPDGQSQLPICQSKNINGYPTWEFSDTTRQSGEVPLRELAEKTGCVLPQKK
ncbi:hypothetical protein HYV91_03000 [Candidatus Wolfebacteria bacterium]|nr:hypothetical protein [Candidatus Wolfebacteria bacterium]